MYLADVRRPGASALGIAEDLGDGKLDSQTGHGSRGQRLDVAHSLQQSGLGAMGPQRELLLDSAGIVDQAHPRGIGPHVQRLDDLGQEHLHLLKLHRPHAARAVDNKHQVCGPGPAELPWGDQREKARAEGKSQEAGPKALTGQGEERQGLLRSRLGTSGRIDCT